MTDKKASTHLLISNQWIYGFKSYPRDLVNEENAYTGQKAVASGSMLHPVTWSSSEAMLATTSFLRFEDGKIVISEGKLTTTYYLHSVVTYSCSPHGKVV